MKKQVKPKISIESGGRTTRLVSGLLMVVLDDVKEEDAKSEDMRVSRFEVGERAE